MLPSYPYYLNGDLLAAAFSGAAGDTVPDVCLATNGHGTTLPTVIQVSASADGVSEGTGQYSYAYPATEDVVNLNVTLVCED
jgi:hypothetical protein